MHQNSGTLSHKTLEQQIQLAILISS
uniref:Uncharacterized protein n=1 Tax=Anguilla anguilla TaxID=7936 RepID=A0A0E9QNK4_ANGAN